MRRLLRLPREHSYERHRNANLTTSNEINPAKGSILVGAEPLSTGIVVAIIIIVLIITISIISINER